MLTAIDLVKLYPVRGGDGVVHALAVRLRRDLPAVTPSQNFNKICW